jgi:uncharacterized paraquat-inducible protein A
MTAYKPKLIECRKCGMKIDIYILRRKDTHACLLCQEPLMELIEMDQKDWEKECEGKDSQNA